MPDFFGTMPRRVVIMATGLSFLILGATALLMVYLYRDHEIREFDNLLTQDANITVQRFRVDENDQITHYITGSDMLYDRLGSEWVWQLFERHGDVFDLIDQSESLGEIEGSATALPFPEDAFEDFSTQDGLDMRGRLSEVALLGRTEPYYLGIAAPILHVTEEVQEAANLIGIIFLGLGCILSLLVYWVVRTGLKPLARLQRELAHMQEGRGAISEQNWPADLDPIVGELRALDGRISTLIDRHRRQASDLAHSLKTPLAILSRIVPDLPNAEREKIAEQTERITTAVRRNLSRLRTGAVTASSTPAHEAVEEIVFAMEVLFRERNLDIRNKIDQQIVFRGDPDDFKEIVGNLLDNACKWAASTIHIGCTQTDNQLVLRISDDGPGLTRLAASTNSEVKSEMTNDEFVSGVGLLIMQDIAELYGGSVAFGTSALGGAEISVTLPAGPL